VKPLIVLAVVAALGAVALAIVVGSRVREDTGVAHPYDEGLRYDADLRARTGGSPAARPASGSGAPCDLSRASCTLAVGDAEVTLELAPRPLRTMTELTATALVHRGGAPLDGAAVALGLEMPGMEMGPNVARLAPAGPGRYAGKAVLVRCPSGRRAWRARVTVAAAGGAARDAALDFEVAE